MDWAMTERRFARSSSPQTPHRCLRLVNITSKRSKSFCRSGRVLGARKSALSLLPSSASSCPTLEKYSQMSVSVSGRLVSWKKVSRVPWSGGARSSAVLPSASRKSTKVRLTTRCLRLISSATPICAQLKQSFASRFEIPVIGPKTEHCSSICTHASIGKSFTLKEALKNMYIALRSFCRSSSTSATSSQYSRSVRKMLASSMASCSRFGRMHSWHSMSTDSLTSCVAWPLPNLATPRRTIISINSKRMRAKSSFTSAVAELLSSS
mmetsp:Transcript_20759/g.67235  ORF Transcript_20759/g.67235 Transcript_20759/m.67235 type:complete len:266 (+) Transcript_20759:105-902(+)